MKKLLIWYLLFFFGVLFGGGTDAVQATMEPAAAQPVAAVIANNIQSDDFNSCMLASQWTYSDPVGDSTLTINGTQLLISVPAGSIHDLWTNANSAPRLMQPANNTDFEIEVKFETTVNSKFQLQGIIVQQDSDNFIRFDFYHDGSSANIFYAKFVNGIVTEFFGDNSIGSGSPMYMRIKREGDVFTQDYKLGNGSWQNHLSKPYIGLNVTEVGVFAGNVNSNPVNAPAFTAAVDYFFNTASPISPEDSDTNVLSLNAIGQGSIIPSPNKSAYNCGEQVTLTATHDPGWLFSGWNQPYQGNANPFVLTISGDHSVTANFVEATNFLFFPFVEN